MDGGGERRSSMLRAGYAAVAVAVAAPLSMLIWAWGHVSWKTTGSPESVRYAAVVAFALLSGFAWYGLSFEPSRALGGLALLLAVGLPTCGGCLTTLSDYNPGGGSSFMFAPNMPADYGQGIGALLLGGLLLGLGSFWFLRRAARRRDPQRAAWLFLLAGPWLVGATVFGGWLCRGGPLFVDRWLLPFAALGALLSLFGWGLRFPRLRWLWAACAASTLLASAWLEAAWSRSPLARCEQAYPALVVAWQQSSVAEYRARGVELERLVCKMSFQYADQDTRLVYGKLADGSELAGAQLFARVGGTPLERASAARELLFDGDCDELARPGSNLVGTAAPTEHDGKLVFHGLHFDYVYGRGTHVGMMVEPTRYEVDLRTFATSFTRL